MTQVIVLPHQEFCPEGAAIEAQPGESVCNALLRNQIAIEHACEMSCACTTCHVIVREGFESLAAADELEEDYLDKARVWSLNQGSPVRLWLAKSHWWWKYLATRSITLVSITNV